MPEKTIETVKLALTELKKADMFKLESMVRRCKLNNSKQYYGQIEEVSVVVIILWVVYAIVSLLMPSILEWKNGIVSCFILSIMQSASYIRILALLAYVIHSKTKYKVLRTIGIILDTALILLVMAELTSKITVLTGFMLFELVVIVATLAIGVIVSSGCEPQGEFFEGTYKTKFHEGFIAWYYTIVLIANIASYFYTLYSLASARICG